MDVVFLDTYALIEILKENPNYYRYFKAQAVYTILNLMEFYYSVLAEYGKEKAQELYNHLKESLVPITDDALQEAMHFRHSNKKLNFSYADSIGYITAKKLNIPFITGDESFRHLENVIFIKK